MIYHELAKTATVEQNNLKNPPSENTRVEIALKTAESFTLSITQLSNTQPILDKIILRPITGGMSQASLFQFEIEENQYVLRVLPPKADVLEKNRQISLMTNAAKIGVGPKVHYTSPKLDALIMDFINGKTVSPRLFDDEVYLINFAKFLRKLHQSPIEFPIASSPFQRFRNFLKSGSEYPTEIFKIASLMTEIEQTLNLHPSPLAPTHLDLHSQNIMIEGNQFFLVDWVNGGMSDPFMDIVTFLVFLDLDDKQTETFLTTYFGRTPSQTEWDRLTILQPVRLFVIAAGLLKNQLEASIDERLKHSKLPTFNDFLSRHSEGELDWSPLQLGLTMLKQGMHLSSQIIFKESLKRLQEEVRKHDHD